MARCKALVAVVLLLSAWQLAAADPFLNPPETNPLVRDWETAFPYQRNVTIDFATNPLNWPVEGSGAWDLVPGLNYHTEGTLDPVLWPSDYLLAEGPYTWVDVDPRFPGHQGMIGVASPTAPDLDLALHLDNLLEPSPFKHVYLEMDYYFADPGGPLLTTLTAPPGFNVTDALQAISFTGEGWWHAEGWWNVEPNPPWEELSWHLTGAPGGQFPPGTYIDNIHVATECVPEPGTAAAFGLGVLCLALSRFRPGRRRQTRE